MTSGPATSTCYGYDEASPSCYAYDTLVDKCGWAAPGSPFGMLPGNASEIAFETGLDYLRRATVGNPGQDERDSGMIPNGVPG